MKDKEPQYKSYLLRLWQSDAHSGAWRARLTDITGRGEQHSFPDLDSLFAYLLTELARSRPPPSPDEGR
jgi:hypothetical protein